MKSRLPVWLWGLILVVGVLIIGFVDYITGYELNFFVFYFAPVALAAWFVDLRASIALGLLSGIVWFSADLLSGSPHSSYFYPVWNTIIRLASFILIGALTYRIRQLVDREHQLVKDLRQSIAEVKVLEAFLPICSICKKIRDQDDNWQQLEAYISEHSGTQFSHGYCPECAKKIMEEAGFSKK